MFLRPTSVQKNGQRVAYWRLVESDRTARGPRQRTVAYLGQIDEAGRMGVQQAADPKGDSRQQQLFPESGCEPRFVEIDRTRVRVENCRQFGGPWLALELIEKLGLHAFLKRAMPPGQEHVPWALTGVDSADWAAVRPVERTGTARRVVHRRTLLSAQRAVRPVGRAERQSGRQPPRPRAGRVAAAQTGPGEISEGAFRRVVRHRVRLAALRRQQKEQAMHARFEKRIEEGLVKIAAGCGRRRQQVGVVERRMGRLLGQNTRAAGLFDVQTRVDEQGAAQVEWKKVENWRAWAELSEGSYVLRSNVSDWSDEDLWRAYIQLTEAEAAFRIQKSDLSLRPVWHQKEDRVHAHILVCFLAFVLWKFLGPLCRNAGLGDEPRRVLAELSELRVVDVILPTTDGREIRTRCVTQPSDHQKILLSQLRLELPGRLQPTDL